MNLAILSRVALTAGFGRQAALASTFAFFTHSVLMTIETPLFFKWGTYLRVALVALPYEM